MTSLLSKINIFRRRGKPNARSSGFAYDPVEDTSEYKRIEAEVDKKVQRAFIDFRLEQAQKRIVDIRKTIAEKEALARRDENYASHLAVWKEVLGEAEEDLRFVRRTIYVCDTETAFSRLQEFGSIHTIWWLRRRILLEDYGIKWQTPSEMNPDVYFD